MATNHPVPDRVKPSFVIFDIGALWRSVRQSAWMSKITIDGLTHCCYMDTATNHPVPDQVKPSFVIFDIGAL